jgi:mycoredoxin
MTNLPEPKRFELYGARSCPYTAELRERLEWAGSDFVEYDVEADGEAFARLAELTGGRGSVPVLVEDGRVVEVGWQGRSCTVQAPRPVPEATADAAAAGGGSSHRGEGA